VAAPRGEEAGGRVAVTALLLLAALGAAAAAPVQVPHARARQRYRVEIGGERVGWAMLRVLCRPAGCTARWESALRLPEASGGALLERRIDAETGPDGRARMAKVVLSEGGRETRLSSSAGPVPATLAELLLSMAEEGKQLCLDAFDESSGERGRACATRRGEWLEGRVLADAVRFRARRGALPDEVVLPGQGARFVADPLAALPEKPPRLFGVEVAADPGAEGGARARFCGLDEEPRPGAAEAAGLPADFPEGESCREKTTRYLSLAAGAGLDGRHVVGVAFDGKAFVWHEWAELRRGDRWVAVDPSFRQLPAAGPRFAVARFGEGDAPARAEAGRRILACWGRSRVEMPR